MGKKSRRNRKTGNDAASATASATTTATATASATAPATATATAANTASSGTNQCHHGSTADKFQPNGEYRKAAQAYLDMRHQATLLDNQDGSKTQQKIAFSRTYHEDHRHLIKNPEFGRFIFAFCTTQYLESNNFKDQLRRQVIHDLLVLGLRCRYRTLSLSSSSCLEKYEKYNRDIETERGKIKVLVRETATYCKCMNEGKGIAKTMDIIGKCHGCKKEFPKKTLSFCNGCQYVKYHNCECQTNHWHIHKIDCKKFGSNAKV